MVVQFDDIGKTAKKTINDDFGLEKKISVKSATSGGVSYTATAKQVESKEIAGDIQVKSNKVSKIGITTTTKILTSGALTSEVAAEDLGVDGLKLTLHSGTSAKGNTLKAQIEYVHSHAAVKSVIDLVARSALSSVVLGHNKCGYSLGAAVDLSIPSSSVEIKNYDFKFAHNDGKEAEVVLGLRKSLKEAFVCYSHNVSKDTTLAGEFLHNREKGNSVLTMAGKYSYDANTTIKSKLDTTGALSLSYAVVLRPKTTLIVTSAADVTQLEKGAKFGLSLALD